jgi:hypothetical protein
MDQKTAPYLMTPKLFESLKNVQGFSKMNGENYGDHVKMVLKLPHGISNLVEKHKTNNEKILKLLRISNIAFTHTDL